MARDGLVAIGGELTVDRLREAYGKGIFPWTEHPVTWWSPEERGVLDLAAIHVPRRLKPVLARHPYRVTFDAAFDAVIEACAAAPRDADKTWITPGFIVAYQRFHRAGYAHSIELWEGDVLQGGIYGVAIGGAFAGESMFHHVKDASKIALVLLQRHLRECGFTLFDTQMVTPVTSLMGAREISRDDYLSRLSDALLVSAHFRKT